MQKPRGMKGVESIKRLMEVQSALHIEYEGEEDGWRRMAVGDSYRIIPNQRTHLERVCPPQTLSS